jgi:2-polyprenyl-3-methyl-5-hydroxy-6-metoxy-1,4-benzoquinol methylase
MKENLYSSYSPSFTCDPGEPFQALLNRIYRYIDEPTRHLHRLRINLFVELLRDLQQSGAITRKGKALDIGSNGGIYSKLISDAGFSEVQGVDIDAPLVEIARKEFGSEAEGKRIRFEVCNAEELDDSDRVDFILCTEVIEHTRNPKKVIDHIHQKLAPGGVAVITLPNATSYPYFLTKWSHRLRGEKIEGELFDHLQYPSHRSRALFAFPDLELIRTTGTNLYYWYFLHKAPGFSLLNRLNYRLAKIPALSRYAQFYFLVLRKKSHQEK